MTFSIVIPTKNEEKRLPKLLESIHRQKGVDFEVIVADAQSTDKTRAIAKSFGAKVVDGGMPGPGRNLGAKHATGEWLCFHDADMRLLDDQFYLNVLKELAEQKAEYGTVQIVPEEKDLTDRIYHWCFYTYTRITAAFIPHIPGGCFFVKRALHERAGGFDETVVFAEDMEYATRLHRLGAQFSYVSDQSIEVSVRRMKKDGYGLIALRFLYAEAYMRLRGPIRRELFEYSFDYRSFPKR